MVFTEIILPVGSAFFGYLLGYITVRADVKNLREGQNELKNTIEKKEIRIKALEDRGMNIMFKTDCGLYRGECQAGVTDQLQDIKDEIRTNRDMVVEKFEVIKEFMGFIKGKMGI